MGLGTPQEEIYRKYHHKKMEADEEAKNQNNYRFIDSVYSAFWLRAQSSCKIVGDIGSVGSRLFL